MVLLAAATLLLVALLGAAAVGTYLLRTVKPPLVLEPSPLPSVPAVVVTSPAPSGTPAPSPLPTPAWPEAPAEPAADALLLASAGDSPNDIVVALSPDGDTYEPLAGAGDSAEWSPDGRSIAYDCRPGADGSHSICIMNAAGSGQRLLIADALTPRWSPDGTRILFSRSVVDAGDAWIADADGSDARKVGAGTGTWSPDGAWILLLGASGAAPDATVIRPDGTGPRALGNCWNATWAPDSARITCTRWDEPRGTVSTVDIATGATTVLFEASAAIGDPTWVSDDFLALTMTRLYASPTALPPENDLLLLDVRAGVARRLTTGLSITGPVDVSPDGGWLAFTVVDGEARNVYLVSVAGEVRQVTGNGSAGQPQWQPVPSPGTPAASPAPVPAASWTAAPGALPVSGDSRVETAAGPDGGAYVVASTAGDLTAGRPARSVLALLDVAGKPRSGWPLAVDGWYCDDRSGNGWPPEVASDGSVTVTCLSDETIDGTIWTGAFRLDATGRQTGAWSYAGENWGDPPRVADGRLVTIHQQAEDNEASSGAYWLTSVASDGTVRTGARYEVAANANDGNTLLGPDGTAYRTTQSGIAAYEIAAFDMDGLRAGWPVGLDGVPSHIAFGSDGRVYLTVAAGMDYPGTDIQPAGDPATRLLVLDRDGRRVIVGADALPIAGALAWSGAGPAGVPVAPLLAPDGSVFVVGEADGRAVVYRLDASGTVTSGWPYHAATALQWQDSSNGEPATGGGATRALPAVGPDDTLYLPLAAASAKTGGSLVAVGPDGKVRPGWPVKLTRAGSQIWSVSVASDGTVYALAVEPGSGSLTSATLLAIDADGTVRSRTTVLAP